MQYVTLSNDSFILKIGGKTQTFSIKSFNYHKIKKLIESDSPEKEILPLMETPDLPEGVYELYGNLVTRGMYAVQHQTGVEPITHFIKEGEYIEDLKETSDYEFIGVYPSLVGIKEDWPEYFL